MPTMILATLIALPGLPGLRGKSPTATRPPELVRWESEPGGTGARICAEEIRIRRHADRPWLDHEFLRQLEPLHPGANHEPEQEWLP